MRAILAQFVNALGKQNVAYNLLTLHFLTPISIFDFTCIKGDYMLMPCKVNFMLLDQATT